MHADGLLSLLARAVGGLRDAVVVTEGERGPDGVRRITFVNRAFTEMTGFSADEAVGAVPDITIGPESSSEALATIQAARDALVPTRVEILKYRKDRTTFWAELDVVPVVDDDGRCTHFVAVMRDITERRLAHGRLLETERLVALGTLAAGIAHEINNPLAFIVMNLNFIEEELPALVAGRPQDGKLDEVLRAATEMRDGVDRVARIVRDVRSFSRVDPESAGPCNLGAVLDRATQMVQVGLPLGVHVERSYGALPPVVGDANRLRQVFLNILINAVDAIPVDAVERRGIDVRATATADMVIVQIRDEGVGIPAEVLPRVFDPFFSTKPTGRGTGLGLSVSHGVVRSLGGEMTIESEVGVGTVVRVELRRTDEAPAPPSGQPDRASERTGRLRLLVVDDEPLVARSLRRALATHHDVVTCSSAKAALEELAHGRDFHVILCDLSMPGMSGAELYEEVAQRWPGVERRFVILTGGACTDAGRAFLERALTPRFDKPVDVAALRREVQRIADRG